MNSATIWAEQNRRFLKSDKINDFVKETAPPILKKRKICLSDKSVLA